MHSRDNDSLGAWYRLILTELAACAVCCRNPIVRKEEPRFVSSDIGLITLDRRLGLFCLRACDILGSEDETG